MRTGKAYVDGVLYEFGLDGKLIQEIKEGFVETENGTYYMTKDGEILKGWHEIDGSTYYFSRVGGYMRTGKAYVDGVLYEFGLDGKLIQEIKEGFVETENGTYYMTKDGEILKGLHEIDGSTYYFSRVGGYMRTGKAYVDGVLYEFGLDGKLTKVIKEGFVETENGTYYMTKDGEILKGWHEID